jgi:hypothetical protein
MGRLQTYNPIYNRSLNRNIRVRIVLGVLTCVAFYRICKLDGIQVRHQSWEYLATTMLTIPACFAKRAQDVAEFSYQPR